MSGPARVTSIEVLPLLAAGVAKFRSDAQSALEDLGIEVRRAQEWIHHDRKEFWKRELQKAYEQLTQARLKLQQARTVRRIGNQEPACLDEQRAVDRAKHRVDVAQEKVEAVRHWTGKIDRAVDDFLRARSQFSAWLEVELPRGVAALNEMSESLVSYISMKAPATDRAGEASPRTADERPQVTGGEKEPSP
ncbi:MAG: hypothetical protein LLG00_12125 [Planctomycetaceae bacterium]|nr:hypothetical protein [Planctomycetaceae bacterium]